MRWRSANVSELEADQRRADGESAWPARRSLMVTTVGGVLAAFFASLCCLGPVILAILGVGIGATGFLAETAGFMKALLPYRPVFIGLTMLLLSLSFYVAYRRPSAAEPSCQACSPSSGSHPNRALLWILTALAVALVLAPYWLEILPG